MLLVENNVSLIFALQCPSALYLAVLTNVAARFALFAPTAFSGNNVAFLGKTGFCGGIDFVCSEIGKRICETTCG
jgi:hypothetical protein